MKRVYFTTVIRKAGQSGKVGHTYAVDWETKNPIWEKRTGGVRGMAFVDDRMIVATGENEIKHIDPGTGECLTSWSYPELRKLHKIYYRENEGILVLTSCGNDSRAAINTEDMRLSDIVSMSGGRRDSLHFNSIGWDGDGQEYHVYHKQGTVVKVTTKETIFSGLEGAHDLEFIDDYRAVINHSGARKTLVGNVKTGKLETVFEAPDGPSTTVAQWGFTRGATYHRDSGLIFTGSSPVDIHMFDANSWERLDWLRLSSTRDESIFDILLDPRDW